MSSGMAAGSATGGGTTTGAASSLKSQDTTHDIMNQLEAIRRIRQAKQTK